MPVTPTGNMGLSLDALADLIAASATFQSSVGSPGNATAAKQRVYVLARSGSGATAFVRPFALIKPPHVYELDMSTGSYSSGDMKVMFQRTVPPEYAGVHYHQDAAYDFLNFVDAVIDDVMDASYTAGKLLVRRLSLFAEPQRQTVKDPDADFFEVWIDVAYGVK